MRQLCWICIFACAGCVSTAAAADTYLTDMMKNPSYRQTLATLLNTARNLPSWTQQVLKTSGNYVGAPATVLAIGGTRYELFYTCKPHDCTDNKLAVMFSPKGAQAWGAIVINGRLISYLGAPSPALQSALKDALE